MSDIRLQDYVAKIKTLIRNGQHDEAIAHCQHVLTHYPKHIEAYSLLGEICLEKEMYRESIEFFQRALSADPENFIARVGLGIIYAEQGSLPEAIWQLERAFELVPGNSEVRRELQRLYAERDGAETLRLHLTRGALGRLYVRNGLYGRAISEFRAVLADEPELPDIRVALVEALWHEGRRLEAVEGCLELLDALPNCLKATLILGEIWLRGGHDDTSEEKLRLARALDPEGLVAQQMMGLDSPVPREEVWLSELDYEAGMLDLGTSSDVQVPTVPAVWGSEPGEQDLVPGESIGKAAGEGWDELEALPDWMQEMGIAESDGLVPEVEKGPELPSAALPAWIKDLADGKPLMAEGVAGMVDLDAPEFETEIAQDSADEDLSSVQMPEWMHELEQQPSRLEEAPAPEWLTDAVGEEMVEEEAAFQSEAEASTEPPADTLGEPEDASDGGAPAGPRGEPEIPASLRALVAAGILDEADLETAMAEMSTEDLVVQQQESVPDWLRELIEPGQVQAESIVAEVETGEEELPDWLKSMEGAPEAAEAVVLEAEVEEAELPDWLKRLEETPEVAEAVIPEAAVEEEEVPDWLKSLEGSPKAAEAVIPEAGVEEEEVPDWLKSLEGAPEAAPEAAEIVIPEAEVEEAELPDWLKSLEGAPEATEAVIPEAEVEEELPDWLKSLEGAPEVAEVVVPEAEVEEAELPDWLKSLEAEPVVTGPVAEMEAAVEEEELPDWLKSLEGAPEVAEAVVPEAEVEEEELPDWLKSLEGAPEATEAVIPETGVEEEELPDWLKSLEGAPEATEAVIPEAEVEEEELPDWLRSLEEEPAEAEIIIPEAEVEEEELPDWLKSLEEVPAEAEIIIPEAEVEEEELPDWVKSLEAEPVAEVEAEEEELPDWLKGLEEESILAEESPLARSGAPDSLRALVEAGILDESDLEVAMAEMSPEDLAAQHEELIPDWVKALMPEDQPPTVKASVPEKAKEPDVPPVEAKVLAAREGVAFESLEEPEVVPEEDHVPGEGVPGWLQDLALATESVDLTEEIPERWPAEQVEAEPEAGEPVLVETVPDVEVEPEVEEPALVEMAPEVVVEPEVEEPALVEMVPEVVVEPEVEEAAPVEVAPEAEIEPEVEEAALVEMVPDVVVEPLAKEPAVVEMETVVEPVAEEPTVVEVTPEVETVVEPVVEEPAVVEPAVAPPVQPEEKSPAHLLVEKLAAELKGSPRNHKVRLELARASQEVQDWDNALNHYEKLITTRKSLPAVIEDLQILNRQGVTPARVRQLLGDAYVQEGQLDEALEMYRLARQALMRS